jgi:hypothetical protein
VTFGCTANLQSEQVARLHTWRCTLGGAFLTTFLTTTSVDEGGNGHIVWTRTLRFLEQNSRGGIRRMLSLGIRNQQVDGSSPFAGSRNPNNFSDCDARSWSRPVKLKTSIFDFGIDVPESP